MKGSEEGWLRTKEEHEGQEKVSEGVLAWMECDRISSNEIFEG